MKLLIQILTDKISNQCRQGQSNLIRIENIDNPIIYQGVCMSLASNPEIPSFIPKLTREKFEEFSKAESSYWSSALTYFHQGKNPNFSETPNEEYEENSFVDFKNAMTKWRNKSAESNSDNSSLILLLGTEAAPDTGGLADTSFVLSPKELVDELSTDYGAWFSKVIADNGLSEKNCALAINTLYQTIFKKINTDIFKLSAFIDSLDALSFLTDQELIAHICETLNDEWDIPSILDSSLVPRVTALKAGKLASAKIITSAVDFIQSTGVIPTKSSELKMEQKFAIYAKEADVAVDDPFPLENPIFPDYEAFKLCLVDFMRGKNKLQNRALLLKIDYAIIHKIIGTKLPRTPKASATKLLGDPVEIYVKMFLHAITQFHDAEKGYPTHLAIRLDHVSLTDCVPGEEEDSYGEICAYLGGILDFFKGSAIELAGDLLQFSYDGEDGFDPFDLQNFETIRSKVKCSGKWGEPSKIDFTIIASDAALSCKSEFRWSFSPYSGWLNAFPYLLHLYDEEETTQQIPTMVACTNMQNYLSCESEDEFYAQFSQMQESSLSDKHLAEIRQYFTGTNLCAGFICLRNSFESFMETLSTNGLFACLSNGTLYSVVTTYSQLMTEIQSQYPMLTAVQQEKAPLLLNCFMITSNALVLDDSNMKEVILPAYHPVMLEKIAAKYLFIRDGFAQFLQNSETINSKNINSTLQNLVQLSSITQGVDAILKSDSTYISCKEMWEYYGVYYGDSTSADAISGGSFATSIVADDETAETMLTATPMSSIVVRNILDYVRTFPSRIDGLNIAFIAPTDMQHIVAAIHKIVKHWDSKHTAATINIKIISINSKKNSAAYLRRWLDSYFADNHRVKVNTSLRNFMISNSDEMEDLENLLKTDDLCFVYHILQSKGIGFQKSDEAEFDVNQAKFPMTFTPDAIAATHGKARNINISQFQFLATRDHTQASHIAGHPDSIASQYRVFEKLELSNFQAKIIDAAHTSCKWVVCVDKAIDRKMLEQDHNQKNSKIIGFTTGEGSYGELNVTVSARKDILFEIKNMLRNRITEKFKNWDAGRLNQAASYCVDELSQHMDGSRILKALNPYDYEIHSFLAYTLMIQVLNLTEEDDNFIIRRLISLDSYQHWFTDSEDLSGNKMRPDFMLLEIPNTPENMDPTHPLDIHIKIIECKMGFQNDDHVSKATKQLNKGLKTMTANWAPNQPSVMHRYWLNQLYRAIIFSPINKKDSSAEFGIVRDKINGILHEKYQLHWSGELFAFWLDSNSDSWEQWELDSSLPSELRSEGFDVQDLLCRNCGQMQIQKMLLPPNMRDQPFDYNQCSPDETFSDESEDISSTDEPQQSIFPVLEIQIPTNTPTPAPVVIAPPIDPPTPSEAIVEPQLGDVPPAPASPSDSDTIPTPTADTQSVEKDLSNVRFLLGEDAKTNQKYYWEFGNKQLANRHLLINGNSGCGKTYCIQTLLMESALQGISSIVVDYTSGFAASKLEPTFKATLGNKIKQRIVLLNKIPANPFKKGLTRLDEDILLEDSSITMAAKIAGIFSKVYPTIGDQQNSAIYSAVLAGFEKYGDQMSFAKMKAELEAIDTAPARSVLTKIRVFLDTDPFSPEDSFDWADIRDSDGTVFILQLAGYGRDIQILITEFLLWDIWSFSVKTGDETKPIILVLDEAQNLNHAEESPTSKILTEGRKFGISGWFATQFMKPQLSDTEIQNLQQANQKLYFCPPDSGVVTVSKNIDITSQGSREWAERLKKLKKGECVTCGNMVINEKFNKYDPRIIKVTSLEDRL